MKRLGMNHGGYGGERIDIRATLENVRGSALRHGWEWRTLEAGNGIALPVLQRTPRKFDRTLYISTGMHGDEPAGPECMRQLINEDIWPGHAQLFLCPCLNPTGNAQHTRENRDGVDLNRDYQAPRSLEVQAHVKWLKTLPRLDMALCLHEDWEAEGFYVYELNPQGRESLAETMVKAVETVCPLDPSPEIEGRPAAGGIIRPQLEPSEQPEWPEAFYLIQHKTSLSYTLEAPSDFPLSVRVDALVQGVRAVLGK